MAGSIGLSLAVGLAGRSGTTPLSSPLLDLDPRPGSPDRTASLSPQARKGTRMATTFVLAALVIFAAGILAAIAVIVRWGIQRETRDGSVSRKPPGPVVPGVHGPGDLYGRLPDGASGTPATHDGRKEPGSWVRPLASSAANGRG
jgi:hypothetical protein